AVSATFSEQLDLSQSTVTLTDSHDVAVDHQPAMLTDGNKTISVPLTSTPPDGTYTVTFAVKDLSGVEQLTAGPIHFTVDTVVPAAPAIEAAGTANAAHPTVVVSGTTAEPGGGVTVTISDGADHRASAPALVTDSSWTAGVNVSGLNQGALTVTATQADAAGNVSLPSAGVTATKDTVAPAVAAHTAAPFTGGRLTASWSGTDATTGVTAYDVRYARAAHGHA